MHPQGLQDEVHMEQETLQTVKALCRNTQETVEMLEDRKTQLKEELKMIYDLQKQEREVVSKLKISAAGILLVFQVNQRVMYFCCQCQSLGFGCQLSLSD